MGCGTSSQTVESPKGAGSGHQTRRTSNTQGHADGIVAENPTVQNTGQASTTKQEERQSGISEKEAILSSSRENSQLSVKSNGVIKEETKDQVSIKSSSLSNGKEDKQESDLSEEKAQDGKKEENVEENENLQIAMEERPLSGADGMSDVKERESREEETKEADIKEENRMEDENPQLMNEDRPLSAEESKVNADDSSNIEPITKEDSQLSIMSAFSGASNGIISMTEDDKITAEESAALVANVIQMANENVQQLEEMEEENDSSLNEGSVQSVKDEEWASSSSLNENKENKAETTSKPRTAGQVSLHEKSKGEKQVRLLDSKMGIVHLTDPQREKQNSETSLGMLTFRKKINSLTLSLANIIVNSTLI